MHPRLDFLRPSIHVAAMLTCCWIGVCAAADPVPTAQQRLRPDEFDFSAARGGSTGSSGIVQVQTLVVSGNPDAAGLYTILLRVPPHTKIAPHSHPDDRSATVISGTWRIAYGETFDEKSFKTLPPGSFYTEPAGVAHFAQTGDSTVVVQITGYGPSGVHYVDAAPKPATP
jgi:quercetin dioxygenase-like cupin family protein